MHTGEKADRLSSPVIDGHIDVPIAMRELYGNNLTSFDLRKQMVRPHTLPRSNPRPQVCSLLDPSAALALFPTKTLPS
jgi:hypothetical protein